MTVPTVARLDYAPVPIKMWIHSQVEATFRVKAASKEPWTVDFIESMSGEDVLYDIGANVGSYTLIAAARGQRVVAVEPGAQNYAALVKNLILNGVNERVVPLPIALWAQNCLLWLNYSDLAPGSASHVLGQSAPGDKPIWFHRMPVMTLKLDEIIKVLGLPEPTHIKLDTDGSESLVLAGAVRILKTKTMRGLMMEMKLDQEEVLVQGLAEHGLKLAARFDERNGKKIGIAYGRFER